MRLGVLLTVLIFVALTGVAVVAPPPAMGGIARPNIVVVLTDDVPAMDDRLWSYMPTMSEMFLNHGTSFTDFHVEAPLCCPGRAGFLTGQHAFNNGVTHNDARLFNPSMTLATALHDIGYRTFLTGKYLNLYDLIRADRPSGLGRVPWLSRRLLQVRYVEQREEHSRAPRHEHQGLLDRRDPGEGHA